MQRLKDLSVRTKLLGGFGIVLALSAIMGITLLAELGNVNRGGVYLGTKSLPTIELIQTIGRDSVDFRRAQLKVVLDPTTKAGAVARADSARDAADIDAQLQRFRHFDLTSASARALWQTASAKWVSLQAQTSGLTAAATRNDAPAAARLIDASLPTYKSLVRTLDQWIAATDASAAQKLSTNRSAYARARLIGLAMLILALVLGIAIALVISRSIKGAVDVVLDRIRSLEQRCVSYLREGLEAFASGDLTRRYEPVTAVIEDPSGDEIGQVAQAVNGLRDGVIGSLKAYNETAERLSETIGTVASTASTVGASSEQMAANSEQAGRASGEIAGAVGEMARGSTRQLQMVEEARAVADEVARAVSASAEGLARTAEVAQDARNTAQEGVGAARQADEAMRSVRDSSGAVSEVIRELAAKSDRIGAIVRTIGGIAEQTNLLALNAAIEAARAGEQGRGFAVVAEEVRKLAEESQHAALEIAELINAIQVETSRAVDVVETGASRTREGAAVVEQTREAFMRIDASVDDIAGRIEQIAATAQQISAGASSMQEAMTDVAAVSEQSSASTEQVSASTQETSASAQEIAASAQALSSTAQELTALVGQFKLGA